MTVDLFTFKKIVGILFMPLPICTLLFAIGLFALFRGRSKLAKGFTLSGFVLLIISTMPMFSDRLLSGIEKQYPQFDMAKRVSHIVVLGCSHVVDGTLPLTSQIHPCSLIRVNEALRIFQANPRAILVTSGHSTDGEFTNAEMNKRLLMALGVNEDRIKSFGSPKDTNEESQALAKFLKGKAFALVTSASHMPRSMRLFEAQGLSPIPAPTEHLVRVREDPNWRYYIPNSNHPKKLERWWYETLGQTWLSVKNWWQN